MEKNTEQICPVCEGTKVFDSVMDTHGITHLRLCPACSSPVSEQPDHISDVGKIPESVKEDIRKLVRENIPDSSWPHPKSDAIKKREGAELGLTWAWDMMHRMWDSAYHLGIWVADNEAIEERPESKDQVLLNIFKPKQ